MDIRSEGVTPKISVYQLVKGRELVQVYFGNFLTTINELERRRGDMYSLVVEERTEAL